MEIVIYKLFLLLIYTRLGESAESCYNGTGKLATIQKCSTKFQYKKESCLIIKNSDNIQSNEFKCDEGFCQNDQQVDKICLNGKVSFLYCCANDSCNSPDQLEEIFTGNTCNGTCGQDCNCSNLNNCLLHSNKNVDVFTHNNKFGFSPLVPVSHIISSNINDLKLVLTTSIATPTIKNLTKYKESTTNNLPSKFVSNLIISNNQMITNPNIYSINTIVSAKISKSKEEITKLYPVVFSGFTSLPLFTFKSVTNISIDHMFRETKESPLALIISVGLVTFFGVLIVAVGCRLREKRRRRRLEYSYSQLTADMVADDDDERMILA